MTICKRTESAIVRRIDDGMTLEEIGKELCESVKDPKRKIIRIMKNMKEYGEEWFENNDNAKKYKYKNDEVKKLFETANASKLKREKAKKIAEASDDEKIELTKLIEEFKDKVKAEDDGNVWDITIKNCVKDIGIPKAALRLNTKYLKNTKTLLICLDNINMSKKIVELSSKYPTTFKETINKLVKDMKVEPVNSV